MKHYLYLTTYQLTLTNIVMRQEYLWPKFHYFSPKMWSMRIIIIFINTKNNYEQNLEFIQNSK